MCITRCPKLICAGVGWYPYLSAGISSVAAMMFFDCRSSCCERQLRRGWRSERSRAREPAARQRREAKSPAVLKRAELVSCLVPPMKFERHQHSRALCARQVGSSTLENKVLDSYLRSATFGVWRFPNLFAPKLPSASPTTRATTFVSSVKPWSVPHLLPLFPAGAAWPWALPLSEQLPSRRARLRRFLGYSHGSPKPSSPSSSPAGPLIRKPARPDRLCSPVPAGASCIVSRRRFLWARCSRSCICAPVR